MNKQRTYDQNEPRAIKNIKIQKEQIVRTVFKKISDGNTLVIQKQSIMNKIPSNTIFCQKKQNKDKLHVNKLLGEQHLNMSTLQLFQVNHSKQKYTNQNYLNQFINQFPSSFTLIKIPSKILPVGLDQLKTIDFPVLSYSLNELMSFSVQILSSEVYCNQNYSHGQIEELIKLIAINYKTVSYHNFSHAFSLMQLNFECLERIAGFKNHFTSEERFYVMVAGLAHDLNHNGTNNMFEVNRKSHIALYYHNEAVLQNMHISTLWKILRKSQFSLLEKSTNPKLAKQIITRLILGTDMSIHFNKIQKLKEVRQNNSINLNLFQDKMLIMEELFHSCDLGNPTLDYSSYISWAALLSYEFDQQFRLEKQYQIQQTAYLQFRDINCFYGDQISFVGKIVQPLWKQLALHFPELKVLKDKVEQNLKILNEKFSQKI